MTGAQFFLLATIVVAAPRMRDVEALWFSILLFAVGCIATWAGK